MIRITIILIATISFLLPLKGQEKLIKEVKYSPEIIRTNTPITFTPDMDPRCFKKYSVVYHFYINGRKIKESNSGLLFPRHYSRGDRIQAEVHLINPDEGYLAEKGESPKILVRNSTPMIVRMDLPDIMKGGEVNFTVEATDADKDEITFSLTGDKVPDYVKIDSKSGEVKMHMPMEFPPTLEFTIKLEDGSGGTVTRDVKFTKRKQEIAEDEKN